MSVTALTVTGEDAPRSTPVHSFPLPPLEPGRFKAEFNGRNQYRLPHPETGKVASFTRATSLAKILEDTYHLDRWSERAIVIGLAKYPVTLGRRAQQALEGLDNLTDIDGLDEEDKKALKRKLNAIAADAKDAAGTSRASEFGTAIHDWLEAVDHGRVLPCQVPELFRPFVLAYLGALTRHGLVAVPQYTERIVCNVTAGVVGTLDRFFLMLATGELVLGDVKTSKDLDFGHLSFAIQLATYLTATHMLSRDGTRWEELPPLEQRYAVILHVPSINADHTAAITWDMDAGRAALATGLQVREMRRTAAKIIPNKWALPTPSPELVRQQQAVNLIRTSTHPDEIGRVWEEYQDIWRDELTHLGHAVIRALTQPSS